MTCKACPGVMSAGCHGYCYRCYCLTEYIKPERAYLAVRLACEASGLDYEQLRPIFEPSSPCTQSRALRALSVGAHLSSVK